MLIDASVIAEVDVAGVEGTLLLGRALEDVGVDVDRWSCSGRAQAAAGPSVSRAAARNRRRGSGLGTMSNGRSVPMYVLVAGAVSC